MTFSERLQSLAIKAISRTETGIDALRYRFLGRGGADCVEIHPYAGYRNEERLILKGRVLKGHRSVSREGDTLSRMRTMLDLYESDEIPGATVELELYGRTHRAVTDQEGFYLFEVADIDRPLPTRTEWEQGTLRLLDIDTPRDVYEAKVLAPGTDRNFAVISDIDDTIIETGATNFLKNWRRVLVERPEERLAVPGAPELYRKLAFKGGQLENPIFYVSSSPWNLYGFLERFMAVKELPPGPLFLKDYGLDDAKFIASPHTKHKTEAVRHLFEMYPNFRFLLIGDDGQKDIDVYADAATEHEDQVTGVFIRDVHADGPGEKHEGPLGNLKDLGVKVFVGPKMDDAIPVASELGVDI